MSAIEAFKESAGWKLYEGLVGLGETFLGAQTVESHIHEFVAPRLLGRDPLAIDRIAKDLVGYLGFRSTGAEARGNSAIDIALWDLYGKFVGQPIAQLLGGFSRDRERKSAPTILVRARSTFENPMMWESTIGAPITPRAMMI